MTGEGLVTISELEMPKAVILRRIKHAIEGKPVQKEAKLALARIVTVFISYLTAQAVGESSAFNDAGRSKGLNATQIKNALERIGFGHLEEQVYSRIQQHLAHVKQRTRQKTHSMENMMEVDEEEEEEEEEDEEDEGEDEGDVERDSISYRGQDEQETHSMVQVNDSNIDVHKRLNVESDMEDLDDGRPHEED